MMFIVARPAREAKDRLSQSSHVTQDVRPVRRFTAVMPDRDHRPPVNSPTGSGNGSTPTVLLVHGAFTDASSWSAVIAELQVTGIDVLAPPNPLRGLAADARYIAGVIDEIDGPVLLVGHAYGGAVITAAGSPADNVLGLVYVTAFAMDDGESTLDINARFPDSLLAPALRPAVFVGCDGEAAVELYIDRGAFPEVFAADLPLGIATVAAATQRPIATAALEEKSSGASWKALPCWYVVATADRIIHPDAQRFMARRAHAETIELNGSHAVASSQPRRVAHEIRRAALSVRRRAAYPLGQ
jgi:pimeloyl-ACP methyl ester carboxylesterase